MSRFLLTDFETIDEVRAWLAESECTDTEREVYVGYDVHERPVVSHKMELSGAAVASGMYGTADRSAMRAKGALQMMREYAMRRVTDCDFPFVDSWKLHMDNGSRVDMDKLPRLEGWMPGG